MNTRSPQLRHVSPARAGFTLIEIAIALGVISFALVAIIGVLPMGMNVQKENREETVINQDASVLMNAICNGELGLNDLANYFVCLTNSMTRYRDNGSVAGSEVRWYTRTNSYLGGFALNTGRRIVGHLSTPRYVPFNDPRQGSGYESNYVVAVFRSMSGPASDKFPQDNPVVQEFAFTYKVYPAIMPASFSPPGSGPDDAEIAQILKANYHDVRLTFRWPVQGRKVGNGRQVYRSATGGHFIPFYESGGDESYYIQPRIYVNAP